MRFYFTHKTKSNRAQAAYAARMQENEKKTEKEARKLVFDPKSGKFVPAKVKGKKELHLFPSFSHTFNREKGFFVHAKRFGIVFRKQQQ